MFESIEYILGLLANLSRIRNKSCELQSNTTAQQRLTPKIYRMRYDGGEHIVRILVVSTLLRVTEINEYQRAYNQQRSGFISRRNDYGFIGGFAAHRALTEAQGQTLILKTKLGEYEQQANDMIASDAKIIELENAVATNHEQNSIANELALANTHITELEQKNATQLKEIVELKKSSGANGQGEPKTILQDNPSAGKSSLKIISHDQEFSMESGDIVAIGNASMIFTVVNIQRTSGIVT